MNASKSLRFVVLVCFLSLAAGCVSARDNSALQSWLGHSRRELFAAWGPPNQESSDGRGGRILIYEHASGYVNPGSAIPEDTGKFIIEVSQTSITTHHQVFYVDRSGRIYLWRRS